MPKNPSSTRKDAIPPTDLPSPPPPKVASTTSPSSASPKIPTSPSKHRGTFYKKSRSTSSQPPAPNPTDSSQSLKVAEVSTLSPPPPPPPPPLPSSLPPSTTSSPAPPVSPSSLFSSYSFAFPPSKSTSSGSISLLDQLGNPAGQLFRRVSVEDESKEGEKQKQETKKRAGKDLKAVKTMREREAAVLKERSEKALKEKSLLKTRSKREEPSAATPSSSLSTTTSEPPPLSVKPSSLKPPIPRSTPGVPTSTIPGASPKEERRRGKHPSTSVVAPLLHALSFDNPPPKSAAPISPPNSPQVATTPPPLASSSSSSPPSSPSSESIPTRPTTPDPPALVAVSKSIYHLAEDLRRKDQEFKESAEAQAAEVALGRARADPPFPPRHDGPSTQARAPLPPPPSLTTTSKPAVLGPTNGGGSSSSVSSAASSTTPLTPSAPPSHLASHPPVPLFPPNPSFPSSTSRPAAQGLSPTPYPHQKPPNRPNPIPPNGQFDASSSSPSSSRFQTGGPIPYSVISVDPKGKGREVPYGPPNPGFPTFQQQQQQQFQHPQGGPPRFRQQQQQPGPQSFSSDQRNRPPPPPPPQAFGCRPEPRPPDNLLRLGPSQPVDPTLRRGPDGRNQHQQYQNRSRSFHSDVQPSLPPSAVTVQPRAVLPYGRFPPSSNPPSSSRPPPTLERSRPSISPITTSIPLPTPPLHLLPPRPIDNFDQSQLRPEFQRRRSAPVDASRPSSPPVPSTPNPPDHTIETSISDGLSSSDFSAPPPPPPPPPAPIPPRCFTPTFLPSSNLTPGTRATDYLLKEKPQALAFQPRNARPSHSGPGGGGGGPSSPVAHHSRTTEEHQRRLDRDRADQQQQVPQEPRWIPPLHNRSGPNAEALDEELGRMGIGRLTSRKTNFTADCYVHVSPLSLTLFSPLSPFLSASTDLYLSLSLSFELSDGVLLTQLSLPPTRPTHRPS
ncbi:hypothetical protein BDY24DRAFT_135922 [Mrakia frigida]|uniref:uncharacterized protein n=1 Tax=Mrakia frigida TaxID=29902 RepID=UPI003FCC1F82